ncbi:uncharacterized protein LOC126780138 isoform X2 [Nymphalis io]|uniref:uncharacterized protein LOC126780138 isoform X2 n=1 Tax=Inachis io TaxID=171585 RepID=UPI002166E813|nr:uncharacterized protein LOC126780138 isoform X2 [Nymphalis io]
MWQLTILVVILYATYKLRHADKIREMHSHSITFELGSIAAGIQERFQRMLNIYKKYANIPDFERATYKITELLNAFHVMQGDYNEIRLEKAIFYDIVRKHETTQATFRHRALQKHLMTTRRST